MNVKSLVAVIALGLVGCGTPPGSGPEAEQCGNTIDDDKDGLADCADSDCSGATECQAASECAKQTDCLGASDYDDFRNAPMPICKGARTCETPAESIDIHFQIKRPGYGSVPVGTINTRFVKKTAVDGSAVDCARLADVASSREEADADQIERTGLFNLQAYDVTPVSGPSQTSATVIPLNAFSVSTGADFIIWVELWSGARSSVTELPRGKRWNYVCVDSGPEVAEIKPEHHWADNQGTATSRTIEITVPDPIP
ncbi:MAG: hypothetical protein WBV82_04040 [Myxococcaceae bacterium]